MSADPQLAKKERAYAAATSALFDDVAATQAEVAALLGSETDAAAKELAALSDEMEKMGRLLARLTPLSPGADGDGDGGDGSSDKDDDNDTATTTTAAAAVAEADKELDEQLAALDRQIAAARQDIAQLVEEEAAAAAGGGGSSNGSGGDEEEAA
jgi:hypothetical protein